MLKLFLTSAVLVTVAIVPVIELTQEKRGLVSRETVENDKQLNALLNDSDLARNHADEFSWKVLSLIARNVEPGLQRQTLKGPSNDEEWELWPDNLKTFPPEPKLSQPPVWTIEQQRDPNVQHFNFQHNPLSPAVLKNAKLPAHLPCEVDASFSPAITSELQEVRRNPVSFGYITGSHLYYQQGLAQAFKDSQSGKPIAFPWNSVEIKAQWEEVGPSDTADRSTYHWNRDNCGNVYRLVALHIMTRALPNWTWATWEWVKNPKRCVDNGCEDSFGAVLAKVASADCQNGACPDRGPSKQLLGLFRNLGVSSEWRYYRLNGSQIDFNTPTILGNSEIEVEIMQSSSCITCHYLARVQSDGTVPLEYKDFESSSTPGKLGKTGPPGSFENDGVSISFVWSAVAHAAPAQMK
jgi:hypothetical protein